MKRLLPILVFVVFALAIFARYAVTRTAPIDKNPQQQSASITLPSPQTDIGAPLMQALKNRRSSRAFSDRKLSLQTISNLLWAAFGVNRPEIGKRTAPSAKNVQEIDIYVATPKGAYLFDAKRHSLQLVIADDIRALTGKQSFTQTAPLNLIYVADYSRIGDMSNNRKEVYASADAGFISQNVYLFCASEGLATVVLGWVDKPALSRALKLQAHQKIIFTQPVGYPKE